jgi:hypothetical protein
MACRWVEKLEEQREWSVRDTQMVTVPANEYRDLVHRVAELEAQMADTASFVQEVADDLTQRTNVPFPTATVA